MTTCPNCRDRARVLIADDSAEMVERLTQLVSKVEGVEILKPALDGVEALEAIASQQPDILILDLQMPRVTGFDVLRELQRQDTGCTIIVVTNVGDAETREFCLARGARYFLRKSDDFDQLPGIVQSILDES